MPNGPSPFAGEIRARTLRRVEIFRDAGDDWRFAESLKSVAEDTAQEYKGRAILELIQNGHDAIGSGSTGRIHVLLSLVGEQAALYVANDGSPFAWRNFEGVTDLGRSTKGAGEGIGNKGLGFRSVLLLCDQPEVYSRHPGNADDLKFSGYSFRFPAVAELAGLTEDRELGQRLMAEASPLNLPVPATADDPEVLKFGEAGFATVVKLPLRDGVAVAEAQRQVGVLSAADAPVLLFLQRISALRLTVRTADEAVEDVTLTRTSNAPACLPRPPEWVRVVDLGSQGQYLQVTRTVNPDAFMRAIRESVTARLVDDRWLKWEGEASVAVALPLNGEPTPGTMYTFLPMKQESPLPAHVHAPFFTELARRDVSLDVPLNEFLMTEIATACLDLLRTLRSSGRHQAVAPFVVDLATWQPPYHQYLTRACLDAGGALETEPFIPVAGKAEWTTLQDGFVLPDAAGGQAVISPEALAALGHPVLDPLVGLARRERIEEIHRAVLNKLMKPAPETLAEWVESLASKLQSAGATLETWGMFYDELARLFSDSSAASTLRGKAIIFGQDSVLLRPQSGERPARRVQSLFFAPSAEDEEGAVAAARLPKAIATRIAYTHAGIPWTTGDPPRYREGRSFLEKHALVREYRTDQVIAVLRDLLNQRPGKSVKVAALNFACALYPDLTEKQRANLAGLAFEVPTASGDWAPAAGTAFSRTWGTEGGWLLDRLLSYATDETRELLALRDRVIAAPADWPTAVRDTRPWITFLRAIGVQDGLPLTTTAIPDTRGSDLRPSLLVTRLSLAPDIASMWARDVSMHWKRAVHSYTPYQFSAPVAVLPGTGEINALGARARLLYARLLALGLATWPASTLTLGVGCARFSDDQHAWPTPVSSYLRHGRWLPLETSGDDGDPDFVRPNESWIAGQGPLPSFVPRITQQVRTGVAADRAQERLRGTGVRTWDDPAFCGDILRELPMILNNGRVPPHEEPTLKKQYRLAWKHLTASPERWPWPDDETVTMMVTIRNQLRVLRLEPDTEVIVPDESDRAKQALFGLTTRPVLIVDDGQGQAVAAIMQAHQLSAVPASQLSIDVFDSDNERVVPSPDLPTLVNEHRQWLETVVALVAELKADSFIRHSEHSVQQILDRLRQIRLVRTHSVRLLAAEEEIAPPPEHTASLPAEDSTAPTVVFWGDDSNPFTEMEQCAGSITTLIGQPQLAAELGLALSRLARSTASAAAGLSDQDLARALQVNEAQIRESRASLKGVLFDMLDRVRIVLTCTAGTAAVAEFDSKLPDIPDEATVAAALEAWQAVLPDEPGDLVARCAERPSLADLRDTLELDFRAFNDVLRNLTPPRPALRHPERHSRAMDDFIDGHEIAILNRLREAFLQIALEGGDLSSYGNARSHEGLEPDPAWLDLYAEPPQEALAARVGHWLALYGADTDLERVTDLPDVHGLRNQNASALHKTVADAELRVRGWAHKHDVPFPDTWNNAPASRAQSALEHSYLADFQELSEEQLLALVIRTLGWPPDMPRTLDLGTLGLVPADLLTKQQAEAASRQRTQHERTHLHVDGQEVSVTEDNLGSLADAVGAGLTEEFLGQTGKARLGAPPPPSQPRPGNGRSDSFTVARLNRMSEPQRQAVGVIGEVAARAWLERRYASVEWVSGIRNMVLGDDYGSDSNGYDFVVRRSTGARRSVYFEVKALSDEAPEVTEITLGESEVREAQMHGTAYHILLVCSALDSATRRIYVLPNPLSSRGSQRYTLIGKGMRYRFSLARSLYLMFKNFGYTFRTPQPLVGLGWHH